MRRYRISAILLLLLLLVFLAYRYGIPPAGEPIREEAPSELGRTPPGAGPPPDTARPVPEAGPAPPGQPSEPAYHPLPEVLALKRFAEPYSLVEGRVLSHENEPLAAVHISLFRTRISESHELHFEGLLAQTTSSRDGSFQIRVEPRLEAWIVMEAPRFAKRQDYLRVQPPGLYKEYRLQPAAPLVQGRVYEAVTGEPIPQAWVFFSPAGKAQGDSSSPRSTWTDQDGRFSVEGLPAGELMLFQVSAHGYLPWTGTLEVEAAGKPEPLKVPLKPAGQVRLLITDQKGIPIPGARLRTRYLPVSLSSDEGGVILLPIDPSGQEQMEARISAEGYQEKVVWFSGKEKALQVRLEEAPLLTGWVRDRQGRPIPAAQVAVFSGETELDRVLDQGESDQRGRFQVALSKLPVREVHVSHPDYLDRNVVFPSQEGVPQEMTVVLERGTAALYGRLLYPDGRPVMDFSVQLIHKGDGSGSLGTITHFFQDRHGRFAFVGLPPGTYTLEIAAPDSRQGTLTTQVEGLELKNGVALGELLMRLPNRRE